jgi:hypothetical protein
MKRLILPALVMASLITVARAAVPEPSVHTITLPVVPFELPDAPGRKAVMDRCVACHTTRYITMQPRFTRETWTNEVTKMKKTFGAPVADEQVEEIVNYLVAVRGK